MSSRTVGRTALGLVLALAWGLGAEASAPESQRLIRARDFIADEQLGPAIEQLQAAVADPKETRRDEVLYWLAHCQHYSGDSAAAVGTIRRLETEFPASTWTRQGQSLKIKIAVRLERNDVLWFMVDTSKHAAPFKHAVAAVKRPAPTRPGTAGLPRPAPPNADPSTPAHDALASMPVPSPAAVWFSGKDFDLDLDLQIQALGGLMRTDAEKVIPILGRIASESDSSPNGARAVFVLAQSSLPQAREAVVRVAKTGPPPVQIAAVRQLARFYGTGASQDLLQVYATANGPVKTEIVKSLGEAQAKVALINIVQSEKEGMLRSNAIVSLGRAGGVDQLTVMYKSADEETKRSIIRGLFNARAEAQLISIADAERKAGNAALRAYALERIRLLGTAPAKEYLQQSREKR